MKESGQMLRVGERKKDFFFLKKKKSAFEKRFPKRKLLQKVIKLTIKELKPNGTSKNTRNYK
jgi:hypothetical protein